MPEKINYHRCTHSNYDRLVEDLIKYGACMVDIGRTNQRWGQDVAERTYANFTARQKKESEAIKVEFMGYDEATDMAKYRLVTQKNVKRQNEFGIPLTIEQIKMGLRVKIHVKSEFYGQSFADGTIVSSGEATGWWRVHFDDGTANSYHPYDLCLVEHITNNKEAIHLLKKD